MVDALYMVHEEPLYNLPAVAGGRPVLAVRLAGGYSTFDGGL